MDDWPEGNQKTLKYLTDNNVPANLIKIDGSTHSKLIIVDGSVVIVGSTNWSYYAIDKNHEANVLISDVRIAREFEEYFREVAG
jgi:cardiolipin synthase